MFAHYSLSALHAFQTFAGHTTTTDLNLEVLLAGALIIAQVASCFPH